jgi:chorismate mutase
VAASELNKLRRRVDALDEHLLKVLNERGTLVRAIGALKERRGESIFAPERERELRRFDDTLQQSVELRSLF